MRVDCENGEARRRNLAHCWLQEWFNSDARGQFLQLLSHESLTVLYTTQKQVITFVRRRVVNRYGYY